MKEATTKDVWLTESIKEENRKLEEIMEKILDVVEDGNHKEDDAKKLLTWKENWANGFLEYLTIICYASWNTFKIEYICECLKWSFIWSKKCSAMPSQGVYCIYVS